MLKITRYNLTKLIWLTVFGIGFGYVEAAVVVYLRTLFYPAGYNIPIKIGFPFVNFGATPFLQAMSTPIILTEIGREAATIVMLAAIGTLSGKTFKEKFAFFIWAFAVWDIFYYIFLKLLINWPASLFTVDVLFLIPVPWLAPVWLPLLSSVIMLITSFVLISENNSL